MRVLIATVGALLVSLMLSEFFMTFMLPRRVRRDPRIARGLERLLWRRWRALARRLEPTGADTLLGFFGPLALLAQLVVCALGLMIGYGLIEWAVAGGSFSARFLTSSGLFLNAGPSSGSVGVHVVELLEAATGVGVLFIVIGYMPAVYSAVLPAGDGGIAAGDAGGLTARGRRAPAAGRRTRELATPRA